VEVRDWKASALVIQCEAVLPDTKDWLLFDLGSHIFIAFSITHCPVTLHTEMLGAQFIVPEQI